MVSRCTRFVYYFAIGRDNSGNYVGTEAQTVSATLGSLGANINPIKPFQVIDLNSSNSVITYGTNGEISDITLSSPLGFGFFSSPRIDITGSGAGAVYNPILDWNSSSINYGKVVGLTQISTGQGYDINTKISITPVIQSVKIGERAQIATTYDRNASGSVTATNILFKRLDGHLF